jgi:D-alanyl-D-alanine carboxypeptidase
MKQKFYLIALFSIYATFAFAQISPDLAGRLQNTLDSICTKYKVKGASAALLLPNVGTWTGTSGISKPGVPLTPQMALGMGSNTKTYIATLLLKLQEKGLVDLDDSIGKWIQGYPNINTRASIRQCLNHTSGNKEYLNASFNDSLLLNPSKIWTMKEVLSTVGTPNFVPGASWGYSNTNFVIAGIIIEEVAKMSFANAMSVYVLEPNNWNSTFFFGEPNPAPIPSQWTMNLTGSSMVEMNTYPINIINQLFSAAGPAGAMMVTAEENVQFWHKLIKGNLLTKASLQEMTTTVRLNNLVSYGLGIFRYNREINNRTIYCHGGTFIGFINENAVDTLSGVTISVLTNQDSLDNDFLLSVVIPALHKHVLNAPPTAIDNLQSQSQVLVYPNPTSEFVTIESSMLNSTDVCQILDFNGRILMQQSLDQTKINVSELKDGIYFLQVISENNQTVFTQKLVVTH